MSEIRCIGSSSAGNGYIVVAGDDRLLLECGVKPHSILRALDWNVRGVKALVSHRHNDHSKYIPQMQKYGITVYSNADVAQSCLGVVGLKHLQTCAVGNFTVTPLSVEHNVPNFAYIIDHPATGRIVFATDCISFPYNINDISTLLLECNYSRQMLMDAVMGAEDVRNKSEYHLDVDDFLETVSRLVKCQKSSVIRNIVLIHLSDRLSDEATFVARTKSVAGDANVYAADAGVVIPI